MDFEQLGEEIAHRVKEAVSEAEARARSIVAEAEKEAAQIRERAEAEARERLAEVRGALDRLESSITGEQAAVSAAEPAAEERPTEVLVDEDPIAAAEDEETSLPEAEVTGEGEIDEAGARLVAMEMALDGEDVEAIATRLTDEFGLVDGHQIATEVHGRAAP